MAERKNETENQGSRKELLLDQQPHASQYLSFRDMNLDGVHIKEKSFILSYFTVIGFKNARFEDCVFNHSVFERCHFRKSLFENVSFTNCMFRDCRFDNAEFINCKLDYAEFFNCYITFKQLSKTLPTWENALRLLAMNLKVNAQERGQIDDCREFLLIETGATERYNFQKAFSWKDSYYKKYSPIERLKGLFTWLFLRFNWHVWGHGEAPGRVLRTSAFIVMLFAGIFSLYLPRHFAGIQDFSFYDYMGVSVGAFTSAGYGQVIGTTKMSRWLLTLESGLGLLMFGALVAALYRRISRR